jgi:hypothetical protein
MLCEVCLDIAIYTHFKVACTTKKREKLALAACCSIFARTRGTTYDRVRPRLADPGPTLRSVERGGRRGALVSRARGDSDSDSIGWISSGLWIGVRHMYVCIIDDMCDLLLTHLKYNHPPTPPRTRDACGARDPTPSDTREARGG